ncbi:hypothetical protein D0Z07_3165 [Hyphodiscus hymeniophilus]|uniref:Uncharacterized protein n=1 Tax=Hyphodiscus hymeniophilus TaxID=353542 RepID=A0A9P6VLG2_9HELO|nr:hypothetical protein D0Z07_3165 [Hyphodiscus hymeniophilus]
MSWMDSWSRPGKRSAVPPPLYSTQGDAIKYCHTCGRVMSPPSSTKASTSKLDDKKYCSSRCRSQKPGAQDRRIEEAFVRLLRSEKDFEGEPIPETILEKVIKPLKGDPRVIVPCSVVEELIFGSRHDPTKTSGRKKNRASRVIGDEGEELDNEDTESSHLVQFKTQGFAGRVRPPQHLTDINGGIGGEKGRAEKGEESEEAAVRRKEGLRVTEEKERVKRAARRGVVFGFGKEDVEGSEVRNSVVGKLTARKCEAIMKGQVVEPSFAKGDWGIRWRE